MLASGLGRSIGVADVRARRSTRSRARNSWRGGRLATCARRRSCGGERRGQGPDAAVSDDELAWAGAAMRHSPHATINVLWASQLRIRRAVVKSAQLYSANVRRLHASRRFRSEPNAVRRGGPSSRRSASSSSRQAMTQYLPRSLSFASVLSWQVQARHPTVGLLDLVLDVVEQHVLQPRAPRSRGSPCPARGRRRRPGA